MRTNYILIDYENVQPEVVAGLDQEHIKLLVFLGIHQKNVPFVLAKALHAMGERAQWIQAQGSGKNSLDFLLAFHIGEIVARDSNVYIHVISKDSGFDPLLQHLAKDRKVPAARYATLADIPLLRARTATTLEDQVALVIARFQRPNSTKPRTKATFRNHLATSVFQKALSDQDVDQVVAELLRRKLIKENGAKLEHAWPEAAVTSAASS